MGHYMTNVDPAVEKRIKAALHFDDHGRFVSVPDSAAAAVQAESVWGPARPSQEAGQQSGAAASEAGLHASALTFQVPVSMLHAIPRHPPSHVTDVVHGYTSDGRPQVGTHNHAADPHHRLHPRALGPGPVQPSSALPSESSAVGLGGHSVGTIFQAIDLGRDEMRQHGSASTGAGPQPRRVPQAHYVYPALPQDCTMYMHVPSGTVSVQLWYHGVEGTSRPRPGDGLGVAMRAGAGQGSGEAGLAASRRLQHSASIAGTAGASWPFHLHGAPSIAVAMRGVAAVRIALLGKDAYPLGPAHHASVSPSGLDTLDSVHGPQAGPTPVAPWIQSMWDGAPDVVGPLGLEQAGAVAHSTWRAVVRPTAGPDAAAPS